MAHKRFWFSLSRFESWPGSFPLGHPRRVAAVFNSCRLSDLQRATRQVACSVSLHFQPHPVFGPTCNRPMERIERQDVEGFTFPNLPREFSRRLMFIEAATLP